MLIHFHLSDNKDYAVGATGCEELKFQLIVVSKASSAAKLAFGFAPKVNLAFSAEIRNSSLPCEPLPFASSTGLLSSLITPVKSSPKVPIAERSKAAPYNEVLEFVNLSMLAVNVQSDVPKRVSLTKTFPSA